MNAGAAMASGDIYVFLHADTRLPKGYVSRIRECLSSRDVAAGAFSLQLDHDGRPYRFGEAVANWRSRAFGKPYGDQILFLRAGTFREAGGFSNIPIMEDYELAGRLYLKGRIITMQDGALTSSRRWARLGVGRTLVANQLMVMAYRLGMPAERLAEWYRR